MKRRIQRSDPYREMKSEDNRSIVCNEEDGGRCRMNSVTYEITSNKCNENYIGETARNAFTRGLGHQANITATLDPERPKPTLKHHVDSKHADDANPPSFKMKVTGVYEGDALNRQVSEAVRIRSTSSQMNRQVEWRQISYHA